MNNKVNLKVSIVLPVYNGEKYLRLALNSILEQTYKNFELIIVDDHSSDSSISIAKEYIQRDDRIVLITNGNNKKLPASLNIGFSKASGDLYTWTSDDNILKPNMLQELVDMFVKDASIDFIYADITPIDEFGNIKKEMKYLNGEIKDIYLFNPVLACFLYKKEIHYRLKGYDTNTFLYEDYDFWLRTYEAGYKIKHYKKQLYYYRFHESSLTQKYDVENKKNKELLLRKNLKRCHDYGEKLRILSLLKELSKKESPCWIKMTIYKCTEIKYVILKYISLLCDRNKIVESNSKGFFNSIAEIYEKQDWYKEPEKCYAPVLKCLDSIKNIDSIIDFGCGTGKVMQIVCERDRELKKITGVDISENMVRVAKERIGYDDRVDFYVGSINSIELPQNEYSAAICMHSFHHYPEPLKCLNRMKACIKRGGYLIIADNRMKGVERIIFNINQRINGFKDGDRWMYSGVEIKLFTILAGFKLVSYSCVGDHSFLMVCKKGE